MKVFKNILVYGGLILVAIGLLVPFFIGVTGIVYKIIFSVGALATLAGRVWEGTGSGSLQIRRLLRIQVWSAIFYCAAAFFLWYSTDTRDWLAFTLAGAVIQILVSVRLPMVMHKEARQAKEACHTKLSRKDRADRPSEKK